MTDKMMNLRTLLGNSSDADLLREMVGFTAHRLTELEVEGLTGAAHGERSPERINRRNGYRDWAWEARTSTVEPRIPNYAKAATSRACWNHTGRPKRRSSRSWQEAYVHGVSTRLVDDLVNAMGMSSASCPMKMPSGAWSAHYCSSRMTNGGAAWTTHVSGNDRAFEP